MKKALAIEYSEISPATILGISKVLEGVLISTYYYSDQVKDASNGYVVNRSNVRVLVEWLQSSVLFQSTYHNYDDVARQGRPLDNQMVISLRY